MKVIFLDIDGVLISHRCYRPPLKQPGVPRPADPDCVAALNHILEATGAFIVVSSTWRAEGVMAMRERLSEWGVIDRRVIGITPHLREQVGGIVLQKPRGLEIQAWLDTESRRRPVESFVILDDDSDMEHLLPRLVHTSFDVGLTEVHADAAIKLLTLES